MVSMRMYAFYVFVVVARTSYSFETCPQILVEMTLGILSAH